jgi:K+-sensing histidine kinase KdpD
MVLVCVTDQQSCGRLIQAGRQLADLAVAPLKVISVRPRHMKSWFGSEELEFLFGLAKQLDAEMIIRLHNYAAEAVGDYIAENPVHTVIVGMPPQAGQSVFISSLEERFPTLPIISVDDHGKLQLVPVFREADQAVNA